MSQRIVVNGVEYDSPEAMPPDVRAQYERAMAALQQLPERVEKNVQSMPGGVKINVTTRKVQYNIDGKTYDDPAQLPPEVRAKIDSAMSAAHVDIQNQVRTNVRIISDRPEQPQRGASKVLIWLAIAVFIIVFIALLR